MSCRSEFSNDTTLIELMIPPSRISVSNEETRKEIIEKHHSIKKKHGDRSIEVIEIDQDDLDTVLAYFAVADVALFSTFWDGFNVLPFQFTAAQDSQDPGWICHRVHTFVCGSAYYSHMCCVFHTPFL